jgi:hypothetical protein
MGAPAIERPREAAAGPQPTAVLDGVEVTQAVQDIGGSIPLVARKKTFVRAYLGSPSTPMSVRGELRVARRANGPWTTVSSFGTAALDPARSGASPAQLRGRREDLAFSLDFRLPQRFTRRGTLWFKLGAVREASTGRKVQVSGAGSARTVTFVQSPPLRLRVVNLRYRTGTPPVQFAATKSDLEHLESWLTRAYPVARVRFSTLTVDATATWPFEATQANAQLAALRALDVAGGQDPGTHYYGMVSDGGGFMRGRASAIPATPDPSAVASGPTGPRNSSPGFGWDTDGSYGDWYGGHELGHTFGRLHPGFCNGNSADDPAYPFPHGQVSGADGAFTGVDVGDPDIPVAAAALPGVVWHDVMTYCDFEWLSPYTYTGIRDRLVAEGMLFPVAVQDDDDDDDDDGSSRSLRGSADAGAAEPAVNGSPVHVTAVVNLTRRTADFSYVTPLVGAFARQSAPTDDRFALRVRMADSSTRTLPVVFKPDVCRMADDDETGLVDTVVAIDPGAVGMELLLDGDPVAEYGAGGTPSTAVNLQVERLTSAALNGGEGPAPGEPVLTWDDPAAATAGAGSSGVTYAVQASTDQGRTWTTLAVGTADRRLPLDTEQFSDAGRVRFRVLTTSGFAQTVSTTEDLPVENL